MKEALKKDYTFRVWAQILVMGTIFFVLTILLKSGVEFSFEGNIILGILLLATAAFLVITPSILIYYFCFRYLSRKGMSIGYLKLILTTLAIFEISTTLLLVFGAEAFNFSTLTLTNLCTICYLISVPISSYWQKVV